MQSVEVDSVTVDYEGVRGAVESASLSIEAGSTVALLGPSGCGKTSLLRAIAGLERPTSGAIRVGDRTVSDATNWVKPEKRNMGMVFQDGALFPHLTVAENIAFGLRAMSKAPSRADQRGRVAELLRLVDLPDLADRLPDTLSGGQQQRVALARSLAPNPSVLLLDEPFSALDSGLRVQVRSEVARILREVGVTSIFVTHDQDEAFVLGDRVAVMRGGRIEQFDTPDLLYRVPTNQWVAGFVGEANFLPGAPVGDGEMAASPIGTIPVADHRSFSGAGGVMLLVRPEQVRIDGADSGSGEPGTIRSVEYYGHDVRYEIALDSGSMVAARTSPGSLLGRGDRVTVAYDGAATHAWSA